MEVKLLPVGTHKQKIQYIKTTRISLLYTIFRLLLPRFVVNREGGEISGAVAPNRQFDSVIGWPGHFVVTFCCFPNFSALRSIFIAIFHDFLNLQDTLCARKPPITTAIKPRFRTTDDDTNRPKAMKSVSNYVLERRLPLVSLQSVVNVPFFQQFCHFTILSPSHWEGCVVPPGRQQNRATPIHIASNIAFSCFGFRPRCRLLAPANRNAPFASRNVGVCQISRMTTANDKPI